MNEQELPLRCSPQPEQQDAKTVDSYHLHEQRRLDPAASTPSEGLVRWAHREERTHQESRFPQKNNTPSQNNPKIVPPV